MLSPGIYSILFYPASHPYIETQPSALGPKVGAFSVNAQLGGLTPPPLPRFLRWSHPGCPPLLSPVEHSEGESLFYIVSPRDVVVAKERDQDDHIDWLLEKKKYEVVARTLFSVLT